MSTKRKALNMAVSRAVCSLPQASSYFHEVDVIAYAVCE